MLTLYRVEYVRHLNLLSPEPIVIRLFVRAPSRGDVERLADTVFEQVWGSTPAKLYFKLANVWSAE